MEEIESYRIKTNELDVEVSITGGKGKFKQYHLIIPYLNPATVALLEHIKTSLITNVAVTSSELLEPKMLESLKTKFKEQALVLLKRSLPNADDETINFLLSVLIQEILGLDKVEYLLNDESLEEIVIVSAKEPIRVYHKIYGWLITNLRITTEAQIQNIANIIARRIGRQVTTLNPLLDAHLLTGDRANAVLYPVSTKGNTITIRKFARDPWTVTDFIRNNTVTSKLMSLIWIAIQYEMNMIVAGGTASGKTSLLNVCMPFIQPNQRIISIEDTREIELPKFLYWCPLVTREPNAEGKGEVSMLDLLVNSLRMRPDRIVLGEIRKKDQAQVLFEAMHTGHSVYSTMHADSLPETISRLVNPPIDIPVNLLDSVNLCMVMFRDRRKGIRRAYQLGEFVVGEEEGRLVAKPNLIYRWNPTTDKMIQHSTSVRLFEDLTRRTGMSQQELDDDVAEKKAILDWLARRNIRHITEVGEVIKDYYLDPESILKKIKVKKE